MYRKERINASQLVLLQVGRIYCTKSTVQHPMAIQFCIAEFFKQTKKHPHPHPHTHTHTHTHTQTKTKA